MFMTPIDTDHAHTPCVLQIKMQLDEVHLTFVFSCLSILGKSVLIVALAAGLLTQFFPCCAFAIRSFSKVSATPEHEMELSQWNVKLQISNMNQNWISEMRNFKWTTATSLTLCRFMKALVALLKVLVGMMKADLRLLLSSCQWAMDHLKHFCTSHLVVTSFGVVQNLANQDISSLNNHGKGLLFCWVYSSLPPPPTKTKSD